MCVANFKLVNQTVVETFHGKENHKCQPAESEGSRVTFLLSGGKKKKRASIIHLGPLITIYHLKHASTVGG